MSRSRSLILPVVLLGFSSVAFCQTVYWTDIGTHKIQRWNPHAGRGVEDVISDGVDLPTDIAVDGSTGKVYWIETAPADFMILRADTDGSNVEFLVDGLSRPSGLAVDAVAGKLYWTDVGTRKIQRANLDGSGVEDLVSVGVHTPVDVGLDLLRGHIYWTEAAAGEYSVLRSNLDGTNMEGIIQSSGGGSSGIAVDASAGRLYWTERTLGLIKTANLDGSQERVFLSSSVVEPVRLALDPVHGHLYWTEASPADFQISRSDLSGSGGEFLITGLTSPSGIAIDPTSADTVPVERRTWGSIKARVGP